MTLTEALKRLEEEFPALPEKRPANWQVAQRLRISLSKLEEEIAFLKRYTERFEFGNPAEEEKRLEAIRQSLAEIRL